MERKHVPLVAAGLFVAALSSTSASPADTARMERFRSHGPIAAEAAPAQLRRANEPQAAPQFRPRSNPDAISEALTGFDNKTNGFSEQGPPFESINEDNVVPRRSFNDNRFIFEEVEAVADGLGPTYNAQSCRECHQNVVTGGASQIAEHRTGRMDGQLFFESLGGSLIQSRATHANIVERVAFEDNVSTFRISTNTLGAGYVEAIANSTLLAIRDRQPAAFAARRLEVPVLKPAARRRVGRFGWEGGRELRVFSADAYLNEMGITTPLFPVENESSGEYIGFGSAYDRVADPEDDGVDVVAFADFMRATKAPSRGPITANVRAANRSFRDRLRGLPRTLDHDGATGTPINGDPSVSRRSATRSSIRTVTSCCTTWARATAFPCRLRIALHCPPDPHGAAVGAADAQSPDARWSVARPTTRRSSATSARRQR